MDLLDANGEVVCAAATADTDAPSTTSSMPGGVEKEASPGEEHPRAALPEFKSDADALLAWRAREALLIWGKSSSATWFEVRASARDPTESDNFEPSELPPPPTIEPRAPTMDLAPNEEMPSPAADALAEREVMTLTMADSCSLEQEPWAASMRDLTECRAVVMAEAGGFVAQTRMLAA
jgi:hypothetical protein